MKKSGMLILSLLCVASVGCAERRSLEEDIKAMETDIRVSDFKPDLSAGDSFSTIGEVQRVGSSESGRVIIRPGSGQGMLYSAFVVPHREIPTGSHVRVNLVEYRANSGHRTFLLMVE